MKALNRFIVVAVLLLLTRAGFAAVPPSGDTLKLLTQHGYLPQRPVLVRVEVLTATGQRDRELWDAEAVLTVDQPGLTLSTNRVTLRNGLGSALVSFAGGGDFTLTATVGGLSASKGLKTLTNAPVTTVSGTLPGTSTTWSNVIRITGNVTVPVGHTLTILSNTLVLVNGVASGTAGTAITIGGTINSLGTESEPVTITCVDGALRWGQIRHNNAQPSLYRYTVITRGGRAPGEGHTGQAPVIRPSNSTILFESCSLTDHADASGTPGKIAYAIGSDLTFRDCLLARARMGPEIEGTALLFTNSWIMDMHGPDDSDGIYLHDQQAGQNIKLSGCVIYGGDDDGIDTLNSTVAVEDCIIRDWLNPSEDAKGISVFSRTVHVRRCLIVDCWVGVSAKSTAGVSATVNIQNSTIIGVSNTVAANFKDNAPGPIIDFRITNSILRGVDALKTDFGPTNFTIGYCDIAEPWAGLGNLTENPLFVNEAGHNYHLQAASPCINTGDPASPLEADGTRADMGAFPFLSFTNTLIALGSAWKYLDDGSNQGTSWTERTFDDSSWSNGLAQLGYGDGDELTVVRSSRGDSTRIITTYFRQAFTLHDASTYTTLTLRLLRDDGGVVYLNGTEIFRSPSMPAGAIAFDTLALSPTPPDNTIDTNTVNNAPPLLLNGTNVIAVEIHQQALTSSDISFDFELIGSSGATGGNVPPSVVLTSPANNATFTEPADIAITATASDSDGSVSKVEFFQNGVKLGEATSAPYSFAWNGVLAGIYTLTAVATDDQSATGISAPLQVTVNSANAPTTNLLITTGSAWQYLDDGTDQGTAWMGLAFDDSSWSNGIAQLGYGDNDEATLIRYGPDPNNKYVTTYFRRKFVVADPARVLGLTLNLLRDDGAIAYLNGTEVFRLSMPPDPVDYLTFANTATEYPFEATSVPTNALIAGTNIMAVEVHQGNGNSSDVSFDLELAALVSAETNSKPIISISAPANGLTLAAPANITITAAASDNDGTVTNVAFYANGAKLADDTAGPYSFAWNNVPAANYSLTASAHDNVGLSSTSSVVSVTVSTNTAPPIVSNKSPAPGTLTSLTQITLTFSKAVAGVNASDLLIQGAPATSVSGSGSNYTFTFSQPVYGTVSITWAAGHGISDIFTPPHLFDGNGPGATWQYTLLDVVAPVVTTITPVPGSTVAAITNVAVTFSESVLGVNASDLLINSSPALALSGSGAGPYVFQFLQALQGTVAFAWAVGHAITDTAGNPFAGGLWSYDLNTNASGVIISEIMYHPSSERIAEEYIELFNKGAMPVNLTGWRLSAGVQFTFPNVSIPSGGYLVVAADQGTFTNKYPSVTNVVGNWSGFLNNSSEDIDLDDARGDRVDSVRYADEGDWAVRQRGPLDSNHRGWVWLAEHDGLGKSLELINPDLSNNSGQNWAPSRVTNGTPGRVNSVLSNNIAPMILEAAHFPIVPRSTEAVLVTARLVDESPSGLGVAVFYRADSAAPPPFSSTALHDDGVNGDAVAGDGLYSVTLPAQPNGTVVEFYLRATDAQGRARTWPGPAVAAAGGAGPTGQVANALYQVDDSPYNPTNNQPLYKFIMTENERAELAGIPPSGDRNSDAQMNGTFLSLDGAGPARHYLAGFRNRGHGSRGANPPNYRANFRSDDPWKGVTAINLNAVNVHVQHVGSVLARKAGVAGANTLAVQVRVNNANLAAGGSPMFGSYAATEVQDGDFAANHFPLDANGNVYRTIRDIPPPDFSYRGEDKNLYRNTYFKQSNLSEDDWTVLIGMLRVVGINNTTSFTTENVRQVVNVEQWLRHVAVMNLFGNNETGLNTGFNDDYFMYHGVNDPRFILTYYDLDTILGEGGSLPPDSGLFTATQNNGSGLAFDRFLHWPDFEPLYYRTLKEMLDTTFAKTNFDALVDQTLGSYVAAGTISSIKNWMDGRRSSVLSQLPPITATDPPVAVISGTPRSPTPLTMATLNVSGAGVISYRFQLNGGGYGAETPVATPILLSSLANGSSTIAVIGKDNNGVWQALSSATVRSWVVNATWPAVRLNEVLARNDTSVNHNGTFPDVIELFNEGSSAVDLSGLRLSDDADSPNKFTFPNGTTLPAGAYLVLYANNSDGTPGFHLGFTLDQEGEGIYLFGRAINGNVVLDSVVFGSQLANLSIGRVAGGDWVLTLPTFGSANQATPLGDPRTLRINEWLAAAQHPIPDDFIELYNPDAQPVALGGLHLTDQPIGAPALHTIAPLTFVAGHGFLAFIADGDMGHADHVNFKLALEQGEIGLTSAGGSIIDCVIYGPQQPGVSFGRCPDGALNQRALNLPTPAAPNACPLTPPPPVSVTLLTMTNTWRYDSSGGDLGTLWRTTNYNDSAWPQGRAVLGYDNNNNPLVQSLTNTVLPLTTTGGVNIVTFYFRAHIQLSSNIAPTGLIFTNLMDDGAVVYLNGQEAYRLNMPAGTITAASFAATSVEPTSFTEVFVPMTNNWLRPGDNVVAVEVHQAAGNPVDVNMGLGLSAIFVTNSPALAGVVINEVLANNATLEEPDGSKPDWVEIYNPSSNAVDLADMSITDATVNPRRWVFPTGSIVPALGFLKVRLDPDLPASSTNAGFGLKANGGAVYLFSRPADGNGVASAVSYGLQAADWSIGRVPDGSTNWVLTVPRFGLANVAAALGDPLQFKINEWMAAPSSGDDWFEVFNPNPQPANLSKLWLSDDLAERQKYEIPALSFLGTGPEAFLRFWAANGAEADFTGFNLRAMGEAVAISTAAGALINGVSFGPQQTDVAEGRLPDGTANIVGFPATPTPGKSNFLPLNNVVVNELLSHTDAPLEDAIELWNPSGDDVNIGGWYLSDAQNDLLKYRIPNNTVIRAGGYVVFYEYQFNYENPDVPFSFSSGKGDEVYLSQASAPGVLTGYRAFAEFGPSENGISFGRFPTSVGADFTAMAERTFGVDNPATTNQFRTGLGKANSYAKVGPVVLNEIMYHPADTNDALEFVELHNILGAPQLLYDPANPNNTWRLRKGIDFNFPLGTIIAPGGYLVIVSFDPQTDPVARAAFRAAYGTNMTLLGPYSGKLDNNGEAIELQKPDAPQTMGADAGLVPYVLVDRINYSDTAAWPTSPDGTGHSLKRIAASLYGNDPFNWTGGPPTPGAADTSGAINTPPILATIGNRTVNENTLLTFTATATDADTPMQILTFSLDAGAPEGANITPGGLFTWAPDEVQGPGLYSVTIRVTDSGVPIRSDAKTISITVSEVNLAPVLNPIGNKVVNEASLVTFTATAVDADSPAQMLTYSLDPGAPPAATIHGSSGVFTWTPSAADGPGVYPVTVRVKDNGSPVAEDFETLTITVNEVAVEPPRFIGITVSADRNVHLLWEAQAGKKYRVQHTADPASSLWFDLGPDITATGPTAMATDAIGANQQRFYRIRLVD